MHEALCDHSTGGVIIGGALKRVGYRGVLRYACAGRGDVNITPDEVRDLQANGLEIGIVVEFAADWLLGGSAAGRDGASGSRAICRACGLKDGVIYLAGDSDFTGMAPAGPTNASMLAIREACKGAADTVGAENVGFYGSYYAVEWLAEHAPWIKWFWQTEAWSRGKVSEHAQILQRARYDVVAGVQLDPDARLAANWGQRTDHPTPTATGDRMSIASIVNEHKHSERFALVGPDEVKNQWKDDTGAWSDWKSLGHPGPASGISAHVSESGNTELDVHLLSGEVKSLWKSEGRWVKRADGGFAWTSQGTPGK